ncbi:hypothetical protein BDA99DRAFT_532750 [Phascolomyces articulosus]|uniref:F-box domain-containing protein n=1 Tax=Phascolomyces articulosus TaxID=60185 RepID=A0AAD5PIA6_9FUNG|nr:hypothetical protein BDA99DRAFT_532750 [Phascolomyces articulosus]
METIPTFIPFFDQVLFEQYTQALDASIQEHAYQRAIQDATIAIDHVLQSQLLILLDIRARAYSLQCQSDTACADAQTMINCVPQLPNGYVRLGNILSMYGRQKEAIRICNRGLQSIQSKSSQNDDFTTTAMSCAGVKQKSIQKLKVCLNEAIFMEKKRVDFFSRLPIECIYNIISLLPMQEKGECILVSEIWRERIFECVRISTWEKFSVKNQEEDKVLAKAAPYFAPYTKTLTIDTSDNEICGTYLKHMTDGHFKKILAVNTTEITAGALKHNITMISDAFHQTRYTLRRLNLDMGNTLHVVTLAEILSACNTVTDLSYHHQAPQQSIGDFSTMDHQHNSLCNLTITSSDYLIHGHDIEFLLKRCPKLRRLVLDGCATSAFAFVKKFAPGLIIYAHNPDIDVTPVPDLPPNFNDPTNPSPGGLRVLIAYSKCGIRHIPALQLLPLLYKNRKTLKTLRVGISEISDTELQKVNTTYPNFKFEHLESLRFICFQRIQEFLFGTTFDAATLKTLTGINIRDVKEFVKSAERFPLLTVLNISSVISHVQRLDLVQLFDLFAKRSRTGLPSLKHIGLETFSAINDTVLRSLADIKTLESVILWRLQSVTTAGIDKFIQRTRQDQLKHVRLIAMGTVTDRTLETICHHCNSLVTVELEFLSGVTKEGVDYLLDNASSASFKWVKVKSCPGIDAKREDIIFHKKKLK